MVTQTRAMTAEELARLPDDGWRYELVRGELRRRPLASLDQGMIGANITSALYQYVKAHRLGRVCAGGTGFQIGTNPDTVRAPAAAVVCANPVPPLGAVKGYWPGAPDLVVEVVSPGDSYSEVSEKTAMWLAAGTRLVWVVDPRRRTVAVYRPGGDFRVFGERDTLHGGDVLPGWTLPIAEVFA